VDYLARFQAHDSILFLPAARPNDNNSIEKTTDHELRNNSVSEGEEDPHVRS
jgi:hypothetical protein